MTWTAPRTWVTGEIVTASEMNTDIRDNTGELKDTVQGDGGATLKHRHLTGTLANRPAAGEAGCLYFMTDLPTVWLDDGTQWLLMSVNHKKVVHLFDDFWTDSVTHRSLGWGADISGAGAAVQDQVGLSTTYLLLNSGTATNGFAGILPKGFARTIYRVHADSTPSIYWSRLYTDNTISRKSYLGLASERYTDGPDDGIFFRRVDVGAAANWFAVCRASSAETAIDTGIVGDTDLHDFEIRILSTSSIEFYIDDVLEATIATNIPAAGLLPWYQVQTTTTQARGMFLDMFEMIANRE